MWVQWAACDMPKVPCMSESSELLWSVARSITTDYCLRYSKSGKQLSALGWQLRMWGRWFSLPQSICYSSQLRLLSVLCHVNKSVGIGCFIWCCHLYFPFSFCTHLGTPVLHHQQQSGVSNKYPQDITAAVLEPTNTRQKWRLGVSAVNL